MSEGETTQVCPCLHKQSIFRKFYRNITKEWTSDMHTKVWIVHSISEV